MQVSTTLSDNTWWVECGANLPSGHFTRNHILTMDKVITFRYKYGNKGVFTTAYMYDSEDQANANLYGDFYLDFDLDITDSKDKERDFNIIRNQVLATIRYLHIIYGIGNNDIKIYFSGSKGIHLLLPKETLGVVPNKHLNLVYRMMAEDIVKYTHAETLDLRIYDNKRLFRLPNSMHPKTNLYKIPLKYDELLTLTHSQIIELAIDPRAEIIKEVKVNQKANMEYRNYLEKTLALINKPRSKGTLELKLDYTPPCVEYLLKNQVGKGQRNDTLAFLASFFRQTGMSEEQTEEALIKWNNAMCDPPIKEQEVTITINSIYCGNGNMGCARGRTLSQCDDKCKFKRKGI